MNNETVCVLGGTGFVGRQLIAKLAKKGYTVKVLTRQRQAPADFAVLPNVEIRQADVHDAGSLEDAFVDCDTVINLVAILNEGTGRRKKFNAVHVGVVENCVAACMKNDVNQLIHISALKADHEAGPSEYLKSKGEAERFIRLNAKQPLRFTIVQPSVIFGEEDEFINRFASILKLPLPVFPLPRPNTRFAPVHVGDVAEAICRMIGNRASYNRTYQLCGPQVFSLKEIIVLIAEALGKKRMIINMPDGVAKLQGRIAELLPHKPFSYDNFLSLTVNSICDKNGFEQIGIAPLSLRAMLPRILNKSKGNAFDRFRQEAKT